MMLLPRLKVDLLYHAMLQTSFVFNKCLTLQVNLIVKCHFGRSLESSFNIARKMGYFDIPKDLLIPINEVENYPKMK